MYSLHVGEHADRVRGAFMGVMIGDARGLPYEMKSPEKVRAMRALAPLNGFLNPSEHRKDAARCGLGVGSASDDWLLTAAVAESIIRTNVVCVHDLARAHVAALENYPFGSGKTTLRGVGQLAEWFASKGATGREPGVWPSHHEGEGGGNGVAMKVMPIALWAALSGNKPLLSSYIRDLAGLTHSVPNAAMAAYTVANVYGLLLDLPAKTSWREILTCEEMIRASENVEDTCFPRPIGNRFMRHYRRLADPGVLDDVVRLREAVGTGCLAIESVVFALGVFIRHPRDFAAAVEEAIDAGGDTDTTASIVGGLVGANVGLSGIPESWVLPAFQPAIALADRFCHLDPEFRG